MVRSTNQDAFFASELSENACFAVVCDGMGGANAGNVASENAVKRISEYIIRSYSENMSVDDIEKIVKNAVISANIEIYDMAMNDLELAGMGTTAVVALVQGSTAVIAHVGDSRIYIINNSIKQLTRDHSVVQSLVESGKISPEEAKFHPRKNVITRAIGAEEEVIVDCSSFNLSDNETLLLCTDGLTNYLETDNIFEIFKNTEIAEVADELVKAANLNGGGDNITVVTVTK